MNRLEPVSYEAFAAQLQAQGAELSPEESAYLRLHSRRYAELLAGLRERMPPSGVGARLLDVGPSLQTGLIRHAFPAARVDTLGFANQRAAPRAGELHVDCDLNMVVDPRARPAFPEPHDLVVLGELIEHLTVAPVALFETITAGLQPAGRLVVQTPNALALHKRLRAVAGRNPLGRAGAVDSRSHNPGHFREYTVAELRDVGAAVGLEVEATAVRNYFTRASPVGRAYDRATGLLPPGTRQGITMYLRRPPAQSG